MSYQRKKQHKKLPPFVPMPWELLNHPAYIELPYATSKALPYFLGKVKDSWNDPQRYLTEFSFTYSEAKRLGFSSGTHSKVIRDSISHGFVDPVDRGGLRGCGKSNSKFTLSQRWQKYGTEDFHRIEWRCFLPRRFKSNPKI